MPLLIVTERIICRTEISLPGKTGILVIIPMNANAVDPIPNSTRPFLVIRNSIFQRFRLADVQKRVSTFPVGANYSFREDVDGTD